MNAPGEPMSDVARISGNWAGLTLFECLRAFFHRRHEPVEIVVSSVSKKGERSFRLTVVLYPGPGGAPSRS